MKYSHFLILLVLTSCQLTPQDMVLIPAGEFTLGTSTLESSPRFLSERTSSQNAQPMQQYKLDAFYIDRHEVTYEQFLKFKPQSEYQDGKPDEPRRGVSWFEADAYCLWLKKRLPTEFEWEKAARGPKGNLFVWGNEFHREYTNMGKTVKPVGSTVNDRSFYDVYDMNGNVSEWTASAYKPYPGSKHEDPNFGERYKVIRGGSIQKNEHGFMPEFGMLFYRNYAPPGLRMWDTGFRCAKSTESK